MLNTYIWAECPEDYWPSIRKTTAISYNDAVEKIINMYSQELDDDTIGEYDDWKHFRDYLNDNHTIALSDLEILEEI